MPISKRSKKSKFRANRRKNTRKSQANIYKRIKRDGAAALALSAYKLSQPTSVPEPKPFASSSD